jgi:tetratricopeptide (TPR) repeat protein
VLVLVVLSLLAAAVIAWSVATRESPRHRAERAEAEARRAEGPASLGHWEAALAAWRAVNRSSQADAASWMGEARACLALGRAAQAERALESAEAAAPREPDPWLLRLELLRLEDRPLEALRIGWAAYEAVAPSSRRAVLRDLTLALLAETPDALARATLDRWIEADPDDVDARVARIALDRRRADQPRAGDPDRASRVAALDDLLRRAPGHAGAREALILALADAGQVDRGRAVLDAWPASDRDARYYRLRGRWDLDYDRRPADAVTSFRRALADLPHDWKTRYRLARALQVLGRHDEARAAAESVTRLRDALDPSSLGPRLDADLAHLDDPRSRLDLADLCGRVGLDRLADAWRRDASEGPTAPQSPGRGSEVLPAGGPRP